MLLGNLVHAFVAVAAKRQLFQKTNHISITFLEESLFPLEAWLGIAWESFFPT